jgi:hypothetical protein
VREMTSLRTLRVDTDGARELEDRGVLADPEDFQHRLGAEEARGQTDHRDPRTALLERLTMREADAPVLGEIVEEIPAVSLLAGSVVDLEQEARVALEQEWHCVGAGDRVCLHGLAKGLHAIGAGLPEPLASFDEPVAIPEVVHEQVETSALLLVDAGRSARPQRSLVYVWQMSSVRGTPRSVRLDGGRRHRKAG